MSYQSDLQEQPFMTYGDLSGGNAGALDACTGYARNASIKFPPKNGWLPVKDTTTPPFSFICSIFSFNRDGTSVSGSGVLIGENLVLTAAHNIWASQGRMANEVFVIPGQQTGHPPQPFGSTPATKLILWPEYRPPKLTAVGTSDFATINFLHDLALIVTRDRIGKINATDSTKSGAGFWERAGGTLGAIPNWRAGNYSVNICGYPGVKGGNAPWRSFDATLKSPSEPGLLFVRNKVCGGQSGGPIWVKRSPSQGGRVLVAIWVGFRFVDSREMLQPCGRLIDTDVLDFIKDIRAGKKVGRQITLRT